MVRTQTIRYYARLLEKLTEYNVNIINIHTQADTENQTYLAITGTNATLDRKATVYVTDPLEINETTYNEVCLFAIAEHDPDRIHETLQTDYIMAGVNLMLKYIYQ